MMPSSIEVDLNHLRQEIRSLFSEYKLKNLAYRDKKIASLVLIISYSKKVYRVKKIAKPSYHDLHLAIQSEFCRDRDLLYGF
jgi:hypothetical protein